MTDKNIKTNKIAITLILFLLLISSLEQLQSFGKGFGAGLYDGMHTSYQE